MSFVLQIICPTNHLSYTSFVINIVCPTETGETSFALQIIDLLQITCPTHHLSYTSFVLHIICPTHHLSYKSFVLHIICPTHHLSYTSFILDLNFNIFNIWYYWKSFLVDKLNRLLPIQSINTAFPNLAGLI